MTDDELKAIEARAKAGTMDPWLPGALTVTEFIAVAKADVPALVAEVRRMRKELAREEDACGDTIDARDRAQNMADELAERIVALTVGGDVEDVIGEHTSANCPWQRAIELADEHIAAKDAEGGR
jgi:hypothetical protein